MSNLLANSGNLGAVDARELMTPGGKHRLGPTHYCDGTILEFERSICGWLDRDRKKNFIVGYVNPHVFNLAWKNRAIRQFLAECDIAAIDGLGVAVAVSFITGHFQPRTVMTPLFDRVLARNRAAASAILIGATTNVVIKGAESINCASHAIIVTVKASGYETIEKYLRLIQEHPECDIILAAMGSPRSEELLLAASKRFKRKLLWNIGGGTLHFYAGTQKRTPHLVSAIGLQWLWRMVHQPSIAPRYILGTPLYLGRLAATLARPGKFNT